MATTKIPSPASVRRALTTLKKAGLIFKTTFSEETPTTYVHLDVPNELMSAKKTTRKKPKHKKVIPQKILADSSEKMSVDCTLPDNPNRGECACICGIKTSAECMEKCEKTIRTGVAGPIRFGY